MSETVRLHLSKLDTSASFRSFPLVTDGGPINVHDYVMVQMDPDRWKALGRPGFIDVTITVAAAGQ